MPDCKNCGKKFPNKIKVNDTIIRLAGRKFCPDCSPIGGRNRRSYIINPAPGMAHCVRCEAEKNLDEFHIRPNTGRPLSYCKTCQEDVKRIKLLERIEKAVALWGGACADCQGEFPATVFRFWRRCDQIPLSRGKNMSWERFLKMLEGCELLCLNCGAMREWQRDG